MFAHEAGNEFKDYFLKIFEKSVSNEMGLKLFGL